MHHEERSNNDFPSNAPSLPFIHERSTKLVHETCMHNTGELQQAAGCKSLCEIVGELGNDVAVCGRRRG